MKLPRLTEGMTIEEKADIVVDGMEIIAIANGLSFYGKDYSKTLRFLVKNPYDDKGDMDKAIKLIVEQRKVLFDLKETNA